MNPIQNLQDAFSAFRKEVPTNAGCWQEKGTLTEQQINAIRLFSKTLKAASHLDIEAIQKRWNKLCCELVQEPVLLTEKFATRISKIQKSLNELQMPTAMACKKTAAEEISEVLLSTKDIPFESSLIFHVVPNWIKPAKKMLERVMIGVYGPSFRKQILANPQDLVRKDLFRLLFIDLLLRGKNPYKKMPLESNAAKEVAEIKKKIQILSEKLSKKCKSSPESIHEILIKDKSLVPEKQKMPKLEVSDTHWMLLRPFVDPTDAQLRQVALSQIKHRPQKAFQIACRITENRTPTVMEVIKKISEKQMDVALDLMDELRESDKALFGKCCANVAKTMLEKGQNFEEALPYIQEVTDEADLLALAPLVGRKADEKYLPQFVAKAQTLEAKAEIVELLLNELFYSKAKGLIETFTDPFLKDLAFESLVVMKSHKVGAKELLDSYAKIQDQGGRLNCLERLALSRCTCLADFAKGVKNESERIYLIQNMALHNNVLGDDLVATITNLRIRRLLEQLVPVKKFPVMEEVE